IVRIRLPPAASHTNFEGHRTQARIDGNQIASWLAGPGRDGSSIVASSLTGASVTVIPKKGCGGFDRRVFLVRKTGAFDIDQPEGRTMRIRAKPKPPLKIRAKATAA